MQARFTHEARREFNDVLPPTEKPAMQQVVSLLEAFGDQLGEPHTSRVRGVPATCASFGPGVGGVPGAGSTAASAPSA